MTCLPKQVHHKNKTCRLFSKNVILSNLFIGKMNFYDQSCECYTVVYTQMHTCLFSGGWFIHKITLPFTCPYDIVGSVCLRDSGIKVMIPWGTIWSTRESKWESLAQCFIMWKPRNMNWHLGPRQKKKKRAETEPVKMEEKRLTLVIGDWVSKLMCWEDNGGSRV